MILATLQGTLLELGLILAVSVAIGVLFNRLRLPPMVGFVAAGALLGPHSLALVTAPRLVEHLAEVGVAVLLFSVGIELSPAQLARLRHTLGLGGGVQIGGTLALGAAFAWLAGLEANQAVFIGCLLALSSTAAVTKLLSDRGAVNTPPGRLAVGLVIAQDLAVVPMILAVPLLAGAADDPLGALGETGMRIAWVGAGLGVALWLVPRLLELVSRTRSQEIFLLTLVTLLFGGAAATAFGGMSLALGAFLIGVAVGGSVHRHRAEAEVEPLRNVLASLFFVSIGMLFDPRVLVEQPWTVAAAVGAVIVGKSAIVVLAGRLLGLPLWVALRAGLLVAQVGEFSFVLAQLATDTVLLPQSWRGVFLASAVLSIAATPLVYGLGVRWTRHGGGGPAEGAGVPDLRGHAVLVGFGPSGQTVARALESQGLQYRVVEMNQGTVRAMKARGVPIFVGDATRPAVLRAAGIERAKLLVVAINDAEATRRTVSVARELAPQVPIVARATFLTEVPQLQALGVREVVPAELEAAIEITVHALRHFLVADDAVEQQVHRLREEAHELPKLAGPSWVRTGRLTDFVPGLGVELFAVQEGSVADGRSLADLRFRGSTGCSVVALRRGDRTVSNIGPETGIVAHDTLVVIGPVERLPEVASLVRAPGARDAS